MTAESPTFCFVLGTGRCGSTLVHEVLARHPSIGFIANAENHVPWLRFLDRWNNAIYRKLPRRLTAEGRLRYAPSESYGVLDREVSPALSKPFRDLTAGDATPWLAARFRRLFESRAHAQATPVFLHKFTGWPRSGFVEEVLGGAKFVHVVRDGRAVANSSLQVPWSPIYQGPWHWQFGPLPEAYRAEWESSGRSFVLLAGLLWKLLIDAFETAEREIPPGSWLTVRYEDILADPRVRFAELLDFLGLQWTPAFERGFAGSRFDTGRSAAFRTDLDGPSLCLLDRSLAGHLQRYGYR